MLKKLTAILLMSIMVLNSTTMVFAERIPANVENSIIISRTSEKMYVDDGTGKNVEIEVIKTRYKNNTRGIFPEHEVGYTDTFTFKISNNKMGAPAVAGSMLTSSVKKKAAQIAANALGEKLGSAFIPGLNVVSTILGAVAWANAVSGKTGIVIDVDVEYVETYLHKEGYYMYGWDINGVDVYRY